jgi:hypothetical protein
MPVPIHKEGAKVFVLACIDPRFTEYLAQFLIHNKKVRHDYDLFALAGAELGANDMAKWRKVLNEHIDIAIDLHDIQDFWVFSHMDCGAYKVFKELDKDDDPHLHEEEIHKLHKKMKKKYPKLNFKGFIMDTKGGIHQIV